MDAVDVATIAKNYTASLEQRLSAFAKMAVVKIEDVHSTIDAWKAEVESTAEHSVTAVVHFGEAIMVDLKYVIEDLRVDHSIATIHSPDPIVGDEPKLSTVDPVEDVDPATGQVVVDATFPTMGSTAQAGTTGPTPTDSVQSKVDALNVDHLDLKDIADLDPVGDIITTRSDPKVTASLLNLPEVASTTLWSVSTSLGNPKMFTDQIGVTDVFLDEKSNLDLSIILSVVPYDWANVALIRTFIHAKTGEKIFAIEHEVKLADDVTIWHSYLSLEAQEEVVKASFGYKILSSKILPFDAYMDAHPDDVQK